MEKMFKVVSDPKKNFMMLSLHVIILNEFWNQIRNCSKIVSWKSRLMFLQTRKIKSKINELGCFGNAPMKTFLWRSRLDISKIYDGESRLSFLLVFLWHLLKFMLTKLFPLPFQLLLILTAVQIVGAIASFTNIRELWAVYSVTQGIQVGWKRLLMPHILLRVSNN